MARVFAEVKIYSGCGSFRNHVWSSKSVGSLGWWPGFFARVKKVGVGSIEATFGAANL